MKRIVNYNGQAIKILPPNVTGFATPVPAHDIPALLSKCKVITSEKSPRISINRIGTKGISEDVIVNETNITSITGLPDERSDTIVVVPSIAYVSLHRLRKDIYVIDEPVRSENGGVIACRSISRPRYSIADQQIKAVSNKLDSCYGRILNILSTVTDPDIFRKRIIEEEKNILNIKLELNQLVDAKNTHQ